MNREPQPKTEDAYGIYSEDGSFTIETDPTIIILPTRDGEPREVHVWPEIGYIETDALSDVIGYSYSDSVRKQCADNTYYRPRGGNRWRLISDEDLQALAESTRLYLGHLPQPLDLQALIDLDRRASERDQAVLTPPSDTDSSNKPTSTSDTESSPKPTTSKMDRQRQPPTNADTSDAAEQPKQDNVIPPSAKELKDAEKRIENLERALETARDVIEGQRKVIDNLIEG